MQIWWNEIQHSHCLVVRRGPDLFVYTSSSVALFQKIHETPKIWHPSEQNYLFVHFNKRARFPGGVQKFWKFWRGGGVNFGGRFWKIQRGRGLIRQIPSVGGGMDIFWNHTICEITQDNFLLKEV